MSDLQWKPWPPPLGEESVLAVDENLRPAFCCEFTYTDGSKSWTWQWLSPHRLDAAPKWWTPIPREFPESESTEETTSEHQDALDRLTELCVAHQQAAPQEAKDRLVPEILGAAHYIADLHEAGPSERTEAEEEQLQADVKAMLEANRRSEFHGPYRLDYVDDEGYLHSVVKGKGCDCGNSSCPLVEILSEDFRWEPTGDDYLGEPKLQEVWNLLDDLAAHDGTVLRCKEMQCALENLVKACAECNRTTRAFPGNLRMDVLRLITEAQNVALCYQLLKDREGGAS